MRAIDADVLIELLTTAIRNMKGRAKFIGAEDDPEIQMEIKAYTDIANGVKDMPTIEPEPHWIPCSERLPERHGWYLCTLKDGRVNCYYWNRKGEWVDNGKKHWFDLYNISSRFTGKEINPEQEGSVYWTDWVIAWMPLPEPYRGEGEQE